MLGEAQLRRQLVEMKRAQLESVTHVITGSEREGGREEKEEQKGRGGEWEEEEQRGRGRGRKRNRGGGEGEGDSSICIFMFITHSKCILTSVTS